MKIYGGGTTGHMTWSHDQDDHHSHIKSKIVDLYAPEPRLMALYVALWV